MWKISIARHTLTGLGGPTSVACSFVISRCFKQEADSHDPWNPECFFPFGIAAGIKRSRGCMKKMQTTFSCPKCGSHHVRPSQRRLLDWPLLPFLAPYRCRECRHRFFTLRVFGKIIGRRREATRI